MSDREFSSGLLAGLVIGAICVAIALLLQYHYKNVVVSESMVAQSILLCEKHGGLEFIEKDGDLVSYAELIAGCKRGVEISFRQED